MGDSFLGSFQLEKEQNVELLREALNILNKLST